MLDELRLAAARQRANHQLRGLVFGCKRLLTERGETNSMAIARQLVELMGGRLTVASEVGAGTTFRVTLPLVSAMAQGDGTADTPGAISAVGPRSVLVVEDDATMRAVLVGLLQDLGHEVEAGANGLDALRLSGERVFDLAYIDLDLPGVDGLRLVRMLRKREADVMPRVHAIAITARLKISCPSKSHSVSPNETPRLPYVVPYPRTRRIPRASA